MAALTEATEAAEEGAVAVIVTMTEDAQSVMMTTIVDALDLQNSIVITDRADDLGAMRRTTAATIVMETKREIGAARQVPENGSRARLPNRNLLRMSVTGEPFSFSNLPLVSAPKS